MKYNIVSIMAVHIRNVFQVGNIIVIILLLKIYFPKTTEIMKTANFKCN